MKILLSLLCIPVLAGLVAFMRYETIVPCSMLRAEAKRFVLSELTEGRVGEGFETLGALPDITMMDSMLEATTASLGPVGCLKALARLHTQDDSSEVLSTLMSSALLNAGATEPPPRWHFISSTDPITDELIERASVRNDDGDSFWIYLNGAQLNAGFDANNYIHDDENVLALRVDGNPAFTSQTLSTNDESVVIRLTGDQVGQIKDGSELLVRYDSITGRAFARFPLRGSTDAIEQLTWRLDELETLALDAERQRLADLQRQREDSERLQAAEAARLAREREAEAQRRRKDSERVQAEQAARLARERDAAAQHQREEQERLAREAEEERRRAEESNLRAEYIRLVVNRIERHWVLPASATADLECEVQLTLIPSGDIVGSRVGRCNGNDAVIRSIEAAVSKSSPLPTPPIPSLFQRSLNIVFTPAL